MYSPPSASARGEQPVPMALTPLLLLLLLLFAAAAAGAAGPQPPAPVAPAALDGQLDHDAIEAEAAWLREADTALLAGQLARMLRQGDDFAPDAGPAPYAGSDGGPADWTPMLIFDDAAADNDPYLLSETQASGTVGKRSRYYRRYPWKRQPGRGGGAAHTTDFDNPYLCNPTREDVFQLLVALHEARAGNLGRTVSFCNRRRPAASVFTNIRFLGRRRRR